MADVLLLTSAKIPQPRLNGDRNVHAPYFTVITLLIDYLFFGLLVNWTLQFQIIPRCRVFYRFEVCDDAASWQGLNNFQLNLFT